MQLTQRKPTVALQTRHLAGSGDLCGLGHIIGGFGHLRIAVTHLEQGITTEIPSKMLDKVHSARELARLAN